MLHIFDFFYAYQFETKSMYFDFFSDVYQFETEIYIFCMQIVWASLHPICIASPQKKKICIAIYIRSHMTKKNHRPCHFYDTGATLPFFPESRPSPSHRSPKELGTRRARASEIPGTNTGKPKASRLSR
jgi:hypothetical protein